jgi:outer membrane protein assembly factor BamB
MRMGSRHTRGTCAAVIVLAGLLSTSGWAITSKITRQSSSKDLLEGKTEDVVVTSRGTIQLGRAAKVLSSEFEDAWSINSIVVSGGAIYLGTSPNGGIYKYSLGKVTRLSPPEGQSPAPAKPVSGATSEPKSEPNKPAAGDDKDKTKSEGDSPGQVIQARERFSNQHVFAMAVDVAGRLLAGVSGDKARLCRYENGAMETIFEPNDAKYIFAVEVDNIGNIYVGTGPQGKVYSLDPSGNVAQLVFDSPDKNILSLAAGADGMLYAGSDTRGLVYRINPRTKTAGVVYDSDEPEISALVFAGGAPGELGDLYATATSAKVAQAESQFSSQQESAGRPEPKEETTTRTNLDADGSIRLKIANTSQESGGKTASRARPVVKLSKPGSASYIYRIDKQGYVTETFTESAVFLCMVRQGSVLLVGSGNDGQLFAVEPGVEREAVVYKDDQATQITAVAVSDKDVYAGTANPARLVLLSGDYASEGTYQSSLIDAGQPAHWGKLQIDADVPRGCKVLVSSRSGNVEDVNDPSFSAWTEPVQITEPVQLRCPLGRFCQYKLVLQTSDGQATPLVREVALASTVPNLAPRVESVDISRLQNPAEKQGFFKISYKAVDDNEDKLVYKIDFRKIGRSEWIELKDKTEDDSFEWNGKTVEDGRYEVRIIASDERNNTTATKLTGSRISDPIVVDNTGPAIRKYSIDKGAKTATLKLDVADELSVISKLEYTIDSDAEWKGTLPDDFVFDTTDESFTIVTEDLEPGEHVIALKISDDVGNTTYKTFEINIPGT